MHAPCPRTSPWKLLGHPGDLGDAPGPGSNSVSASFVGKVVLGHGTLTCSPVPQDGSGAATTELKCTMNSGPQSPKPVPCGPWQETCARPCALGTWVCGDVQEEGGSGVRVLGRARGRACGGTPGGRGGNERLPGTGEPLTAWKRQGLSRLAPPQSTLCRASPVFCMVWSRRVVPGSGGPGFPRGPWAEAP